MFLTKKLTDQRAYLSSFSVRLIVLSCVKKTETLFVFRHDLVLAYYQRPYPFLFLGHTFLHHLPLNYLTQISNKRQLISLVHYTVQRWYSSLPGAGQTVSGGQTHANVFVSSSENLISKAAFNLEHLCPQHTLEKVRTKNNNRKGLKQRRREKQGDNTNRPWKV